MSWYYIEKEYYDFAEDIEGVSIHYAWTPLNGVPDWQTQRATRYMPRVKTAAQVLGQAGKRVASAPVPQPDLRPLRKKTLKLPMQIEDPVSGKPTNKYLLHHYFEIFQDGRRHYSPLYTEEIVAETQGQPSVQNGAQKASASVSGVAVGADPQEVKK